MACGSPILRPATAGDLIAVAAIEAAVNPNPWSKSQLRRSLTRYRFHAAEADGAVLGFSVSTRQFELAELLNIGVAPQAQGQGLGGRLLDACLNEYADRADRLLLEVRAGNGPAIALYRSRGFVQIDRRKAYYPGKDKREDALVMIYEFRQSGS